MRSDDPASIQRPFEAREISTRILIRYQNLRFILFFLDRTIPILVEAESGGSSTHSLHSTEQMTSERGLYSVPCSPIVARCTMRQKRSPKVSKLLHFEMPKSIQDSSHHMHKYFLCEKNLYYATPCFKKRNQLFLLFNLLNLMTHSGSTHLPRSRDEALSLFKTPITRDL